MNSITEIWQKDRVTFQMKSLSQILSFAGNGKLRDNNATSKEFRELLAQVPSDLLQQFTNNCLSDKFEDSGVALQDIMNQIGSRLEFDVELGLYKGKKNTIGFDGIWRTKDGFSLIVEVKTTDVYRISLDKIVQYRKRLIEEKRVDKTNSSVLIIVGREDTGELEAQIRGSRHAWDIRVISSDSLLKLLSVKETLNDPKIIQQINEILKPKEYTRLDKLIELIFLTSQDIQLFEGINTEVDVIDNDDTIIIKKNRKSSEEKIIPVNFYGDSILKIEKVLKVNLIKRTKISFTSKDKNIGLVCAISKVHKQGHNDKYWFAFHPHQMEFLDNIEDAYVAYGCGSSNKIVLIPYHIFKPFVNNFWTTELEDRMYWHVVIHDRDNKLLLAQPRLGKGATIDITEYRLQ